MLYVLLVFICQSLSSSTVSRESLELDPLSLEQWKQRALLAESTIEDMEKSLNDKDIAIKKLKSSLATNEDAKSNF